MSKLFRMSEMSGLEEGLKKTAAKSQPMTEIIVKHASRLRETPLLDESGLIKERAVIEICAEKRIPYAYHIGWSSKAISSLKEYAAINGCQSVGVDPSEVPIEETRVKTAATVVAKPNLKPSAMNIGDAFKLDESGDMKHMASENWEGLKPTPKFNDPKSAMWAGSVTKIGGGENYEVSPHLRTKPGQNSITDPDAIGNLSRQDIPDIAASLREHSEARSKSRELSQKAAEAKLAKEMRGSEHWAGQNGTIRLTETLIAQPGLRAGKTMPGVFEKGFTGMEEKTAGETLCEENEKGRISIQRDQTQDERSWDQVSTTRSARMSETLDGLEVALKKQATSDNKGIMSFSGLVFSDETTDVEKTTSATEE